MKPVQTLVLYDGKDVCREIGIGRDIVPVVPEGNEAVSDYVFSDHAVSDISSGYDYEALSVLVVQMSEFVLYVAVTDHLRYKVI